MQMYRATPTCQRISDRIDDVRPTNNARVVATLLIIDRCISPAPPRVRAGRVRGFPDEATVSSGSMRAPRPFLTAQWRNLGLITFDVDPALLQSHVPPGCELDLRDGRAFVSFVMFDFLDTRVGGVRW